MKKIYILAGEPSGDMLASKLLDELSLLYPLELYGSGGPKLKAMGQRQICDVQSMAAIGLEGVVTKIPFLLSLAKKMIAEIEAIQPDLILLVDYHGYNMRFAKRAKKLFPKIPTIGLVAPQVWVWHYSRVKSLKKYYDKVLCILPFEEELLQSEGVNATYIGNPVVDGLEATANSLSEFCETYGLDETKPIIGLLPGSRQREIKLLMQTFMDASDKLDSYQFIIARADSVSEETIHRYIGTRKYKIVAGATHDIMKYASLLWICSGTATLEATMFSAPMIVCYDGNAINVFIFHRVTKLRQVALPNIISAKMKLNAVSPIVPELLAKDFTAANLIKETNAIWNNYATTRAQLSKVAALFIGQTPMKSAAKIISDEFF